MTFASVDASTIELRSKHQDLVAILPDNVRESLSPDIDPSLGPPPESCALVERALRCRVEEIVAGDSQLADYLRRARRHAYASALTRLINERYRELAGDTPVAMDDELQLAQEALDPNLTSLDYEVQMAMAAIVPMIAWADFLAMRLESSRAN